jgi:hypothetical protein
LADALPVPLRVDGVFLTERPAIIALYVSLAVASDSVGGGGGIMGGFTMLGTLRWPDGLVPLFPES